jgi:hypothetical protein
MACKSRSGQSTSLRNKYFIAVSFAELVVEIEDATERDQWADMVEDVKQGYGRLSKEYRKNTAVDLSLSECRVGSD